MKKVKKTTIICIKCMKTPTTRDTIKCKAWLFSAKNCDIVLIKTSPTTVCTSTKVWCRGRLEQKQPVVDFTGSYGERGHKHFFNLSCQYYFCWPRKIRQGVKILVVATFKPAPSTNLNLCVCGYQRAEQFRNIQKDWIWIILIIDSTLLDVSLLSRLLCDQIWRIILKIKAKKQSIYYILSFLGLDFTKTSGKKYWTKDVCKNCNFCQKCIFVNGFGVWIFCQFCIFFLTAAWQLRGRFELSLGKWSFTPFPSFSI